MKVRWILIGCGKVVLKNKNTPFMNENNEIVGIITTNKNTTENAIKKLGLNIKIYENYEDMLNNTLFDAIYICTPPKYHFYYLKKLVSYNKLILVEKPFVLNFNEALEIYNLYKNNVYAFLYKSSTDKIIRIKEILDSGKYGDILEVKGNFKRFFKKEYLESWIYNKDISGGGRVFDIIQHILDVLYFLFGDFNNIKSNVIRDSQFHDCETKINTEFFCNKIKVNLNFDMECNNYEDEIEILTNQFKIKFSINDYNEIYIYKDDTLIDTINVKTNSIWGIELINKIDSIIKNDSSIGYLPDLKVLLKIQKCVDEIIN